MVRLSHNFIVHLSPTEEHGASRNQQVSLGQRGDQHRGCRRATPNLQLLTIRTKTAQNRNLLFFFFFNPSCHCHWKTESPPFRSLFQVCEPSLRPCSPSVLTTLSERRRGRDPGNLGARVTSGGLSSDCSCPHPSRQTQGRTTDLV